MATKVIVSLPGEHDYSVRIGSGIIAALGRNLREIERFSTIRDVLVITDSDVGPLYLAQVKASLSQAGFKAADIVVPAGENSKSLEIAGEIWSAMAQLGMGRDCVVVALGGGVVGDLAGYVAASYMRGVPVVQVPTTLLAMVDSSVGGKTAVNLPEGKNLVGAFWQPSFVCADTDTLETLPEREWRCGCAEVAKSAVIDSDDFFFWLLDFFLLFFNFRWLCSLFVSSETIQETHDASFCHLYVALSNKMFHVKHLLYQYIKLQLNYVFCYRGFFCAIPSWRGSFVFGSFIFLNVIIRLVVSLSLSFSVLSELIVIPTNSSILFAFEISSSSTCAL